LNILYLPNVSVYRISRYLSEISVPLPSLPLYFSWNLPYLSYMSLYVSCILLYNLPFISHLGFFCIFPRCPYFLYLLRICLYLPVSIQNLPARISCIFHESSNFSRGCSFISPGPLTSVLPVFSVDLLVSSMDLPSRILLYIFFPDVPIFLANIFVSLLLPCISTRPPSVSPDFPVPISYH
jgi:hypothetical protein